MRVPLRVLIVEHLPEQAELVAHELGNAGFALAWSIASDLTACRFALESGVDLVVADCDQVGFDLPALMALVGALGDPPPVVSLSTDDAEEVAGERLRAGASAFLHKFQLDEIGGLVRSLIETRGPRPAATISGPIDARSFAENACDLVAELAADGRLIYVNPSVEKSLGYAADELNGRRAFELVHPEDLAGALAFLRSAVETGSAKRGIHRLRRRDGSWCWLESAGNPYRSADGERRVIAISRDVTERLEGERAPNGVARVPEPGLRSAQAPELPGPLPQETADRLGSLLVSIGTELESVERRLEPSSPLRRDLDRVLASVGRGAALVRQMQPTAEADPLVADDSKGSAEERGSQTILLVLGEDPVRSVIRADLEEEGYAVLQAASGDEALGKAARHPGPIHLMLSDAAMPGIDGWELAERVGASRPRTRLVLMSESPADCAGPLPRGIRAPSLLHKPFTLAALRAKLREALEEDPVRQECS
jgi:PAS domain S-box-containing protein